MALRASPDDVVLHVTHDSHYLGVAGFLQAAPGHPDVLSERFAVWPETGGSQLIEDRHRRRPGARFGGKERPAAQQRNSEGGEIALADDIKAALLQIVRFG